VITTCISYREVSPLMTAGISGQLGSRIVKELLQSGVSVVAGVDIHDTARRSMPQYVGAARQTS
jgi:nucleoside-diphosphate-sugar epimerase